MIPAQPQSLTAREIGAIPGALARLLSEGGAHVRAVAGRLRRLDPPVVVTIARGSSDHAATYLKYAIELASGTPVASISPSVGSVWRAPMRLSGAAGLVISQSGQSPDILAMAEAAKAGGALVVSITNTAGSPLAMLADSAIDILAGPETSIAATKTFVSCVAAGLLLLAHWREDGALLAAIEALPGDLERALACDWTPFAEAVCAGISEHRPLYVLGRGPTLAIAQECALKFKEVCQIPAEAFSAAEFMHGPVAMARQGMPVLALAARDAAEPSIAQIAGELAARGADVHLTSEASAAARRLPFAAGSHPLTDPLCLVVSFYAFIEALARRLGLDPDAPPHLRKVILTV